VAVGGYVIWPTHEIPYICVTILASPRATSSGPPRALPASDGRGV